jgi:hypothetical protein
VAFVFAGISFAQQAQSGSSQGQYPIGGGKKYKEWWCSQNWEKCKQMKLERLSAKKECLEKSQSYEAYSLFLRVEYSFPSARERRTG